MAYLTNSHALIIGISDYHHLNRLSRAVTYDAQDFYEVLVDLTKCAFSPDNVELLVNELATRNALIEALVKLANRSDSASTVLLYFSGHAGQISSGEYAGEYLLPVDAKNDSQSVLAKTALPARQLTKAIHSIKARRLVLIFDCCHAAGLGQLKNPSKLEWKSGLTESYYNQLAVGAGRVVIASSRSEEVSWVLDGDRNSLFTRHLLDGLRGGATTTDGFIRIFDLYHFLQPRVTAEKANQHPIFKAEIESNFSIALAPSREVRQMSPTSLSNNNYLNDVFISYHDKDPDKTWARKVLLPALQDQGLKVIIDFRHFRLGSPKLVEMERAIIRSRYTLAIVTPAYMKSSFSELENLLADQLGLENGQRRLLLVLRKPCHPNLRLRARMWLDMTQDNEFNENLARLVYELQQPPEK